MDNLIGLGLTLLAGIFILIGSFIVFYSKNSNKFIHFSISIAFGVMLSLVVFELIPEVLNIFTDHYSPIIAVGIVLLIIGLGLVLLKVLDKFIPDHENECEDNCEEDSNDNFYHIGIVATISLLIHQTIEGMAIYGSAVTSFGLGMVLVIGVGLHSIPLGMVITSTIYKATESIKKTSLFLLLLSLAPFIGGLIIMINSKLLNNELVLGSLLSLTIGMLLYITLFELLPHLQHSDNKKNTILGILIGVIIMIISIVI